MLVEFEAEVKTAIAMLATFGPEAAQRASRQADEASLSGNLQNAARWRRVTAHILASVAGVSASAG